VTRERDIVMGKFSEKVAEAKEQAPLCTVGRAHGVLDDDDDRAAFATLFRGREWATIRANLGGKPPSSGALRLHGIGNCMCPDGTALKGALLDG
jgi:hypothetical protein